MQIPKALRIRKYFLRQARQIINGFPNESRAQLWQLVKRYVFLLIPNHTDRTKSPINIYWMEIPALLMPSSSSLAETQRATQFDSISWAQFCLFLAFRLHDDIFDEESANPNLLFVGNAFSLEAVRALQSVRGLSDDFWKSFHRLNHATNAAIIRSKFLHLSKRATRTQLARCTISINGIFKIALEAVCDLSERPRLFPTLSRCYDALGRAGQLIDDAQDIDEDLAKGKMNLALRLLTSPRNNSRKHSNKLDTQSIHRTRILKKEIDRLIKSARRHAALLSFEPLDRFLRDYHMRAVNSFTDYESRRILAGTWLRR